MALRKLGVPNQFVDIILSFQQDMKAQIRFGEVDNGLRQLGMLYGTCTVQSVLMCSGREVNNYRPEGKDGVRIYLRHKLKMMGSCLKGKPVSETKTVC